MNNNNGDYVIECFDVIQVNEKVALYDGTIYIKTENDLFKNNDGSPMTQRKIFNSLVDQIIRCDDGMNIIIVKSLPNNKKMYNELFRRYPKYQNVKSIRCINNTINNNLIELLEISSRIKTNEPDINNKHYKNKIISFDTRIVDLYDGKNAYGLTFSIAKMKDDKYVAYAKKSIFKNSNLLKRIKKEAPTSVSRGALPCENNISRKAKKVNENVK